VRRPLYEQLLMGRRSTLIFAPRGGGKTATRLMIQSECRPAAPYSSILAVDFTDFSPFIESYTTAHAFSLGDYLPYILRRALKCLLQSLAHLRLPDKQLASEGLEELRYWMDRYAPSWLSPRTLPELLRWCAPSAEAKILRLWAKLAAEKRQRLPEASPVINDLVEWWHLLRQASPGLPPLAHESPSQTIHTFAHFANGLLSLGGTPCEVIYLLVDGVDEYALTQADATATQTLLKPWLGNLHFLETPGLVVKFFLPAEQRPALEALARLDRLEVATLVWDRASTDSLRNLLRRRIQTFSQRGMQRLDEMCAAELRHWIEDAMLEEASDSPRSLLRLGYLLFAEHCRSDPEPGSEIQANEWQRALERFRATQPQQVHHPAPAAVAPPSSSASPGQQPLLRVDILSGRVFRGDEEILPPLAEREFKLLAHMYRRREQVCSRNEIALAVYGSEGAAALDAVADADQAIGSLVYRLRKKIEPPGYAEPLYIQTIPGRGFRLQNAA